MSRGLSNDVVTAITSKVVRPAILVYLNFTSGPVRMWSGSGNLVWGGDTYTGAGTFGGASPVTETKKLSANGVELSLSGVPTESITDALTLQRGREAKMWRAYFNAAGTAIVADPYQSFGGFINKIRILDSGETSKIIIALESRHIDMHRARNRRWTDAQQQADHPGDLALEFVAGIANQQLPWGQPSSTGAFAKK